MTTQYCFFDLDGTIVDSSRGIINSINYALNKMKLPLFEAHETSDFIGPPLAQAFCRTRRLSDADGLRALEYYRENYRAGGIFECDVYEGIRELLEALKRAEITCVLATCKPHEFAQKILVYHGLDTYFSFVSGPEMDGTRGEKHEVIAYAVEQLGISDRSTVLMIGDRAGDVLGAKENGIACIGALWGFGSREELFEAGAFAICEKPTDVTKMLGF